MPTLSTISNKLFGIDISSDPVKVTSCLDKVKVRANLTRKDITLVKYPANSFDLIVAFSVFEHIEDGEPIIKEMYRILKPNGELLVGMPRVDKMMQKLFKIIGFNKIDQFHVTSYKSFRNIAEKYLKLVKFSRVPSFLPTFAAVYYNMLFKKGKA